MYLTCHGGRLFFFFFLFPNGCTIKSLSWSIFGAELCNSAGDNYCQSNIFFFVNSTFMGDSKKLGLLDRFSFNQNMVPSYPYKHGKWCQICSKMWSRFLGTWARPQPGNKPGKTHVRWMGRGTSMRKWRGNQMWEGEDASMKRRGSDDGEGKCLDGHFFYESLWIQNSIKL